MGRVWSRLWGLVAIALVVALGGPVAGQQQPQQQDPFNGHFGAMQLAPPAPEAAHLTRMMGEALNALQPQRPGRQDVYLSLQASGASRCSNAKRAKPNRSCVSACTRRAAPFS